MPSPTNSTKNATESGFSVPTSNRPSAAAIASPQTSPIERGEDDPPRAQRQPQDQQHRGERDQTVEDRVFLQDAELRVVHRDQPGQPHPRLIGPGEIELLRRRLDRLAGGAARLDGGVIEHRLDLDEAAQLARGSAGLPSASSRHEKCAGRPASTSSTVSAAMFIGRASASGGTKPFVAPSRPKFEPGQRAAQARIGAQRLDQRRRLRHLAGDLLDTPLSADRAARCARKTDRPAARRSSGNARGRIRAPPPIWPKPDRPAPGSARRRRPECPARESGRYSARRARPRAGCAETAP